MELGACLTCSNLILIWYTSDNIFCLLLFCSSFMPHRLHPYLVIWLSSDQGWMLVCGAIRVMDGPWMRVFPSPLFLFFLPNPPAFPFLLLHVVLPCISLSTYNASLSIFYFCYLPLCLNTLIKHQTYHIIMSHPIHRIPLWLRWMASFYPPPFRYVLLGYAAGY